MSEPGGGLHVAVDMRILDREGMERTGLGRYALESLRALRAARPGWRLTVHSNRPDLLVDLPELTLRRTRWPTASALGRAAWRRLGATSATRPRPDVWFAPAFFLPPGWSGPAVVTIHDLVFMLEPGLYRSRLGARYATRAARRAARRAGRILCGSAATADRVVRHLGVDAARVVAVPWGVSPTFRAAPGRSAGDYLLFVGRWEARKGLEVLHTALREAAGLGIGPRLVLAGGPGWKAGDAVAALLASPGVEPVSDPDDERLATLYAGAMALVYPSRMEGFGFPVAEAMASGCPVIASDLPELRELARDAALYVPVGDSRALADAIVALASDPQRRERLAARGRELAAELTWESFGEAAARAIEAVLPAPQRLPGPTTSS